MCVCVCVRSNYDPVKYNGTEGDEETVSKATGAGGGAKGDVEKFSFSDLPRLDYGSGDEKEDPLGEGVATADEHSRDQMALALRELSTSTR